MNPATKIKGQKAIKAVVEACDAIEQLIKSKGEKPSTALVVGYLSIMATRIIDDIDRERGKK